MSPAPGLRLLLRNLSTVWAIVYRRRLLLPMRHRRLLGALTSFLDAFSPDGKYVDMGPLYPFIR